MRQHSPGRLCWRIVERSHEIYDALRQLPSEAQVEACILGHAACVKLFGGGDGLPRAKVDAVVRVVDQYVSEEAELRGLRSEKQAIHPSDLPPAKRRALVEEVFAILEETEDRRR